MAKNPSQTECWTQIKDFISILELWEAAGLTAATNFVTLLDAVETNSETNYDQRIAAIVKSFASQYGSLRNIAFQPLALLFRELARSMGITEVSLGAILAQIRIYMHNNAQSVNSRGITYNAYAAKAGNIGDMTVTRVTTDWLGHNIEIGRSAHAVGAEVIQDFNGGAAYGNDQIRIGSTVKAPLPGDPARLLDASAGEVAKTTVFASYGTCKGDNQLKNNNLKQFNAGAGSFNSWYSADWTNIDQDTTEGFKANQGTIKTSDQDGSLSCAEFSGNAKMSQLVKIANVRRPYIGIIRYKYNNAGDTGDIILTIGANSVTIAAAADAAWHTAVLTGYYSDYFATPLIFEIEIANYNADVIYIDDPIFIPMDFAENGWVNFASGQTAAYAPREKAAANPYEGDSWTVTDVYTESATIQRWSAIAFAPYAFSMPSNNAGGETIADP